MWGFASSPLVVADLVVVYAGAANAGMIAYDRHSGEKAWTCPAGTHSYSSPHLADPELILMMSNAGLAAADAADGSLVWQYDWPSADDARIIQPALLENGDILVATGYGLGTHCVSPTKTNAGWQVRMVWESRNLKPYFNDLVCHDGYIYGFDDKIMTCIDPESGNRVWKGGRYGYGQLLLLADQSVLLVTSERGDVALVEARPDGYKELAKFHAMDGKTWNHPVVAHGKLFVRNAEEAVCYKLPLKVMPGTEIIAPAEEPATPTASP
jgi:outer membrane protein assembly factor BamB